MAHSDTVFRSYETCKNLALSQYAARTPENQMFLECFKEKYESEINSPRDFERITDLETLLKILEKRCTLSPDDISVLEYIYGVLNINKKMLENYKTLINRAPTQTTRGENVENQRTHNNASFHFSRRKTPERVPFQRSSSNRQILSERGENVENQRTHNNASFHFSRRKTPERVPFQRSSSNRQILSERVVNEISTRLGSSWQELARYLKVQECKIHGISQDKSLRSNEAKARAMLQEYEKQVVPEELKIKLMKALRLAGRMDIHDDVEKLFLRET